MALKGKWKDKVNGVDLNSADDINQVAHAVIELEEKGSGGISQETDPTVPEWAKQPSKPKYTASEVGALPSTTKIPAKTSDLTNDSNFITESVSDLANYYLKSQTYTKDEVNALVSAIPKFSISVVSSLPDSNISETTIYLVGGGSGNDLYSEYIYTNGKWEILGSQKVDLTGYATESWVNTQLADYLKGTELNAAVESALTEAKESGKFNGDDGADGRGIQSITRTKGNGSAGTTDTYTITFTDNTTTTFTVYNGKNGTNGKDGKDYVLTDADIDEIVSRLEGQSGTGAFTITATEGDGELTDVSAAFAEMYEAYQAGKLLVLVASSPYTDAVTLLQCEHVTADNIIFSTLSTIGGENGSYSANIFSDDTNVYQWVEISGGVDEETLNEAVEAALAKAKASGEFDGADGERGTGILSTTTGIVSYTTTVNGVKPTYRILLGTLKTQAGVDKVLIGDHIRYSTYLYPIITLDSEYAYMGARISLQGSAGASSEWYTGTGITGTSTTATIFSGSGVSAATVGDMYLNTSTYNTYRCTTAGAASAAKWVYACNIKGAAGTNGTNGKDGKDYSFDPTVYDLPVLELTGDISPIKVSKDNEVSLTYVYGDKNGSCTLKGQGSSSYQMAMNFINAGKAGKFNYTIKFDNAFEAKEGWGSQKKYCLKANWIDHSHSRNVVSCKLWGMSVKARSNPPTQLKNLPNGGAIDGFPIVIMLNGEFHGLYTFNIPKDEWMFGLAEDTTKTQAIFSAHQHSDATQFKGLLKGDDSDFELEFISDKNNTEWATASLNRLITACMNSRGGDLDTEVAKYLDWDSAIDYYIHCVVEKGSDAVDKNFLLTTFDGTKWYFTNYDRDTICGLAWDGSALDRPVSDVKFVDCKNTSKVFELIYRFKTNALKARYQQLRSNILSESRINQIYENFAWAIPSPVAQEDVKKYPTIRGSFVNGIDQICRWMRQRLEACDEWINALPTQETPVEPDKPEEIVNLVPTSTDTDGSIFNGVGYKDNVRLSSSGGVSGTAQNGSVTTGFIPYEFNDVIRIKGATWLGNAEQGHWYINFYNSSKTLLDNGAVSVGVYEAGIYDGHLTVVYDSASGVTTFSLTDPSATTGLTQVLKNAKYFRLNAKGKGSDLIVTVNQEIT